MSNKTTLLTNIYNEEYLLPFWLNHHKDMFDHGIIIDYRSTDNSVKICKEICPTWDIITTRNAFFGAVAIDQEFMDIENNLEGIKIVLNTTEFLFCETPIKDVFSNILTTPTSFAVTAVSPYSLNEYNPKTNTELFKNLLNPDVKFNHDRGVRQIHNYKHGAYTIGRHSTNNPSINSTNMHIVWLGYYPFNNKLLERKLQIKNNMPEGDKQCGFGFQHLFEYDKLISLNKEKVNNGIPLQNINNNLYNLINSI